MTKIKIEEADRPFETVGEAVRAEIIGEITNMLTWSTGNDLDDETVAKNKALHDIIENLTN